MSRGRSPEPAPAVSVVIASYRWPEALTLSLRSALAQSLADIEVLVVEDGRDRASREVVQAAGDARARWLSLRRESGSQAGPNALGWKSARAPVVAYLGHDDLWHPEHLAGLLAALRGGADLAHAITIAIGPPPQDRLFVAGIEPWSPATFVPPSSLAHLRDSARLGPWPAPGRSRWPVDYGFLLAAAERGATVATSPAPTVLKFPASWRLDVYRTRDVSLQLDVLARLATDPQLPQRLLEEAIARGAPTLAAPPPAGPGEIADHARRMKGLAARHGVWRTRWRADEPFDFPGWHAAEVDGERRPFRWTAETGRAIVRLDAPRRAKLTVRVTVVNWLTAQQLAQLSVDVDGVPLTVQRMHDADGSLVLSGELERNAEQTTLEIGVSAPALAVAADGAGAADDDRRLGVAVREIALVIATGAGRRRRPPKVRGRSGEAKRAEH